MALKLMVLFLTDVGERILVVHGSKRWWGWAASLLGSSLTVPIRHGRLCLGTWQGIYLCEHRRHGGSRRLVLTVDGEIESQDGSP